MTSILEFYDGDNLVVGVESAMVPHVNSLISIRAETWEVVSVTYAVDHAGGKRAERTMRANIDIVRAE